jgi:uncharacterized membrane protein YccC
MNDLAREHTTQQRQQVEERDEVVLSRAEENLETADASSEAIREQVTDDRLHAEHQHDNALSRAEAQIDH